MNLKNTIMVVGSAMLPIIIVLVIFFSPYNFDYLFSNSKVEKFRDDDLVDYNNKCDPKTSHEVDMPVKNIDCTERGKTLLTVQEFMDGKSLGCFKGKPFY